MRLNIMKKEQFLVLVLFGVLLIAGCDKASDSNNLSSKRFVGGDTGLKLSFSDDPPTRVGDNSADEFDVVVVVENEGEHDIDDGKVIASLQGIDREAFS